MVEFTVTLLLVLLAATLCAAYNRGAIFFPLFFLLSDALGFMDPMTIALRGSFDVHAWLMVFAVLMMLMSLENLKALIASQFFPPVFLLMALWAYGVLAPTFRGHSTLLMALEGSKELMTVFLFCGARMFLRTEREVATAWTAMLTLGAYYCALEIVAQIGGAALLGQLTYFFRIDDFGLWKVYVPFWPVILLFFLYALYRQFVLGKAAPLAIALGGAGLLLTFYRSYLLATIVAVPVVLLLARIAIKRVVIVGLCSLLALMVIVGAVALMSSGSAAFEKVSDAFFLSGIRELNSGSGGSLEGREAHAKQLERLTELRPMFGYGFVNRESSLAATLNLPEFAGSVLGFVDRGIGDVLIKFGYLGGALLYGAFAWIAWIATRIVRRTSPNELSARALALATCIVVGFIVQPVHSPLSYSFALVPIFLAMASIDHQLDALLVDSNAPLPSARTSALQNLMT